MHLGKAMHQMYIDQMELPLDSRGEAPTVTRSGEAEPAVDGNGSSGLDERQLMERMSVRHSI